MTAHSHPQEAATSFVRRHVGPSPRDVTAMLETVGAKSLEALMAETLPSSIRQQAPLDLGTALSETEALSHMRALAAQNQVFTSLIGQGYCGTLMPALIQRNVLENPAWYTAYTPYQPEVSQGRLEALFDFRTMIYDLTGLDIADASCSTGHRGGRSDGAGRAFRAGQTRAFVDRDVIRRRWPCRPRRTARMEADGQRSRDRAGAGRRIRRPAACPGGSGAVRDLRRRSRAACRGALAIVAADLLALTLLASPGGLGADIAVGSRAALRGTDGLRGRTPLSWRCTMR